MLGPASVPSPASSIDQLLTLTSLPVSIENGGPAGSVSQSGYLIPGDMSRTVLSWSNGENLPVHPGSGGICPEDVILWR